MVSSGADHQRDLAGAGRRKALGAYYTPADVVDRLLDLSLNPILDQHRAAGAKALAAVRVIDPACGDGSMLTAAAVRISAALVDAGWSQGQALRHAASVAVTGIDVDPVAAGLCRKALEGLAPPVPGRPFAAAVHCADALTDRGVVAEGSFDLVVGNPPFLSQLASATAADATRRRVLGEHFGSAAAAYTDPAALFLLRGAQLAKPNGGVVALIEPIALLASASGAEVRRAVAQRGAIRDFWYLGDAGFDAAVQVCVPVVVLGEPPDGDVVDLFEGRPCRAAGQTTSPAAGASWSSLLAAVSSVPDRVLVTAGTIGDLASATADFRDQYYGIAPHVTDLAVADEGHLPRLITTGLVDPAELGWGQRTTRFNKVAYLHPRVDRKALPPKLAEWASRRLVPKLLVATQTKVIEVVVDEAGLCLPSVPLISVVSEPRSLWMLAAALTSPALSAEASRRHLGSGRNASALRLRAVDVLALALPADVEAWRQGAEVFHQAQACADHVERRALLGQLGVVMNRAYGLGDDPELVEWWLGQMPSVRR